MIRSINVASSLGFTVKLHQIVDVTPETPLPARTTPSRFYHTWRYSHWMRVGEELWAYAEVARPDLANEIRLFRMPV